MKVEEDLNADMIGTRSAVRPYSLSNFIWTAAYDKGFAKSCTAATNEVVIAEPKAPPIVFVVVETGVHLQVIFRATSDDLWVAADDDCLLDR